VNYKHLTIEERACIYQFKNLGMSIRAIGKALNRSASTISRELKRNFCGYKFKYLAHTAQKKYHLRRLRSHRKVIINEEVKNYVESKIEINWSPEQLIHYQDIKPECMPSLSTIYRWINVGYLIKGNKTKLRRKGNFTRPAETRGRFNIGKSIKRRPKEVHKRLTIGHWEADTVVSGRKNCKALSDNCFITLAERKSRLYLAKHIPDRKEETVTKAIIELLNGMPVETITCDRGKEFAGYKKIERELECNMYFADPYCAWQKGTNENLNGLLREYFPKGMDLSKTNNIELNEKLDLLNNRPRKCIGYKTPNEVFLNCCT